MLRREFLKSLGLMIAAPAILHAGNSCPVRAAPIRVIDDHVRIDRVGPMTITPPVFLPAGMSMDITGFVGEGIIVQNNSDADIWVTQFPTETLRICRPNRKD